MIVSLLLDVLILVFEGVNCENILSLVGGMITTTDMVTDLLAVLELGKCGERCYNW